MNKNTINKFSQLRVIIISAIGVSLAVLNYFEKPVETKISVRSSHSEVARPLNPSDENKRTE